MPLKKSIYRRADAQHFQLVHRSQRDPLINDPDASQHVLKQFHRENDIKKGKTRADLESLLAPAELAHDAGRGNIGEASLYGIYYDDTDYDYMQHLRQTGVDENGVDTIMIPAPAPSHGKGKDKDNKGKARAEAVQLRLPPEVLPSSMELPRAQAYDAHQAVPDALAGLQPDMDLHLRQVLEALEEDAFVDDGLDDGFFTELVRGGEREEADGAPAYPFREEGIDEGAEAEAAVASTAGRDDDADGAEEALGGREDEPWEARFARFKQRQKGGEDASDADGVSEGADTVERLPVIGGKKRRRGAATASSGFSMTSSAVYRNEALSLLDERYDQIEKHYQDEEDSLPDDDDDDDEDDDDEAPDLLASREDFEAAMDDFLDNYELVGRRMQPVLPGNNASEKLDTIRRALGGMRVTPGGEDENEDKDDILMPDDVDDKKDRWDCETILTTYTNLENHPRLIRVRDDRPVPKIRLDSRTGLPSVDGPQRQQQEEARKPVQNEDSEEGESSDEAGQVTIARPRNESREDKRARKQAVKQVRQARRAHKKATKEQFLTERKHQVKVLANKTPDGIRKL